MGLIASVLCALAVGLKFKFGFDDSLDVVGVHLVGGLAGSLLIGLLATDTVVADTNGLFYGGGLGLLGKQFVASFAVLAYSFILTYIIGFIINKTMGFRVDEEAEITGIDTAVHDDSAYDFVSGSSIRSGIVGGPAPAGINDQSVREAAPAGKE